MEAIKKKILILSLIFVSYTTYAQNSLQLWYNHPAKTWEGTLPLGNGRLGMTPDGGVEKEHIVLNDISLWSGSPQDANNYDAHKYLPKIRELLFEGKNEEAQKLVDQHFICLGPGSGGAQWGCFQTLGNIDINFTYAGSKPTTVNYKNYQRSLSLDSAIATNTYEVNGVKYKKEYFTSFGTDVDLIRITANKSHQINCSIEISRSERAEVSTKNNILQMEGQLDDGSLGKGMKYLAKVKAVVKGGTQYTKNNRLIVENASELIIYISEKTNYKNSTFRKDVDELMAKAVSTPYKKEKGQHIESFQKLYKRVYVNLGGGNKNNIPTDQRLIEFQKDPKADNGIAVLFYQFGRYLSISSTRIGLLPPNLQGLWANQIHTPWNGDYHLDVNVQMNHWGTDVSNLSELDLPLMDLVKALIPNGEKTAKAYYNAEGWVAHVITNLWQFTEPGESASWGVTKCGSGWLCDNLWQHYAFTNDTNYLRKIYPILKGSALFYKSMLVRDPKTKWLVTSPSSSPENSFVMPDGHNVSICMGPTIDNQIIRELYDNVITTTKIFNIDKPLRDTLEQQLTQLPPAGRISPDGRIMEWLEDYKESDLHHRHISHLYGVYPANQITPDSTPDVAEAAKKTLNGRGDDGPGWSIAYKMLMWSRLYDGNRAYKLFINLMRPTTSTEINYGAGGGIYPNLFSAGPPFQIDANFGGCAGIAEMLLQSHAGYINLLPAIPDEWKPAGEVRGLKARGNFIVDFKWENGKITTFQIYSSSPQQVKVKINGIVKTVLSRKL